MREDILFQELRELRVAQAALTRAIETLLQRVAQVFDLLVRFVEAPCRCHGAAPPSAPVVAENTKSVYTSEEVAELFGRHVQTITKWCRALENAEKVHEDRLREQQRDEMERRGVPYPERQRLFKFPPRTVRHINGGEAGVWEITPAGLAKLKEMDRTHPKPTRKAKRRQREEVVA
jgi:hypothetical protein